MKIKLPIIFLLFLSGCATPFVPPGFSGIGGGDKLEMPGLIFAAPETTNWYVSRRGYEFTFYKAEPPTHTYIAQVNYSKAPEAKSPVELMNVIKSQWDKDNKDSRYVLNLDEIRLASKFDTIAVKMHRIYKDKGAVNKGENLYLLLEDYGYSFVHPYDPEVLVTVLYSERFAPGEQKPESEKEREKFISDVKPKLFLKNEAPNNDNLDNDNLELEGNNNE